MSRSIVKRVQLRTLKSHPMNEKIYRPGEVDDLATSMRRHGQLEPIVLTPDRTILSGHRRVQAMRQLGWSMADARIERHSDDVVALIEFNRSRTRTWSERYREVAALFPRLSDAAAERRVAGARAGAARRHGLASTNIGTRHGKSRVFDEIAELTGIRRETCRKLVRVFEAIDADEISPNVGEKLDAGDISINRAYQAVVRARASEIVPAAEPGFDRAEAEPLPFDLWQYSKRSTKYELPAEEPEAAAPPQAWERLISLYSDEGDLVVDPMAGRGTVARVAERLNRRGLAFDLSPRGPGVQRYDLLQSFPPVPEPPRLIILDPPYGMTKRYSRRRADISTSRTIESFFERLDVCLGHCLDALAPGGVLAVVMGNLTVGGEGIDLAWRTGELLHKRGLSVRRIWLPFSAQTHAGHRIQRARRRRELLSLQRELFVTRVR